MCKLSNKTTQRFIKNFIKSGQAIEIKECNDDLYYKLHRTHFSAGIYGINGALFRHRETGDTYAICERTPVLFFYF